MILDEKYFVLDIIKNEYIPFSCYYQVLLYASNRPYGSFGNSVKDKRWQYKRKSMWDCFYCIDKPIFENVQYIVYDLFMNAVNSKQIEKDILKKETFIVHYRKHSWRFYSLANDPNYMGFRNGPVPLTGHRGRYNYFRKVKTTQERRMNCAHGEYTRGKRRNLSTSWDDVGRSDAFIKHSWKKVKKKRQWM